MKRYHPIIAIIIGNIVAAILIYFLPLNSSSAIITLGILILDGFLANYFSRTNKAIIGLYAGLLYSISILPSIIIFKQTITLNLALYLILPVIMGLVGGFISMMLRNRLDDRNE